MLLRVIISYAYNMYTQVVNLSALSPLQLQKVYVKFTRELYILSKLQHPRVVIVHGCATTLEELTLVMEVSACSFKLKHTLRIIQCFECVLVRSVY
jgi:hypothetical protein